MAVKFHFKCSHCTKDNYFDPKKAQTLVPLMESQDHGQYQPQFDIYWVQCAHCQKWQEVRVPRRKP